MKSTLNIFALLSTIFLISTFCQAQGLERGNLLGLHVITVFHPTASMDDFKNFYVREVLPEY